MILDKLKAIDGYFDGDKFILRGILGHAVLSVHDAENFRSLARLIDPNGEAFVICIDEKIAIQVSKDQSLQLRKEYLLLAKEIEGRTNTPSIKISNKT